jgi:cytochrome c553
MIGRWLLGAALALGVANAHADIDAGKRKSAVCQGCHGIDGNGTSPQFPRLAGQYEDYLVQALIDYQNGSRKNAIMAPFAENLSRRDIEDLAAYFASLPNGLTTRPLGH